MDFNQIMDCLRSIENNLDQLQVQGRRNAYAVYGIATLLEDLKRGLTSLNATEEGSGTDVV